MNNIDMNKLTFGYCSVWIQAAQLDNECIDDWHSKAFSQASSEHCFYMFSSSQLKTTNAA